MFGGDTINKREKEVIQAQLDAEKATLKEIEKQYKKALEDIDDKIAILLGRNDADLQNVIYQVQFQKQLKTQVQAILEQLQADEFATVSEFLTYSYQNGFVGAAYSMHGQGVPVIMPIDPKAVVKAIQTDSQLKTDLYTELGVDVTKMKKSISSEISRGIASGQSYSQIAQNISKTTKAPLSRVKNIVETESHRINQAASYDASKVAKSKGADVLRQWNSTLDGATRPTHRRLDGQIREMDEPFEMDGKKAMYPGDFGDPAEDCRCRCQLLQRARWALGEDELKTLKDRAEFYGLDKSDSFKEFEKKYMKAAEQVQQEESKTKFVAAKTVEEAEEYGRRFIVKKTWSGNGEISYKGMSVDNANKLNETLTDLFATFDLPLLENIKPMNFRQNIWKGSENAPFAYRSSFNGELYFNPKIAKNAKAFDDYFKKGEEAFEICKKNIDRFTGSQREMVERYVKAGRQLVADNAKDRFAASVQHEMGHHIQNQILWKNKDAVKNMNDRIDEFGVKISGYATSSKGEYVAESFCAFMNGEADRIDPFMKEYFEGLMK